MTLHGKWPGIIRAYSAQSREVRVEIPGVTDGATEWPTAEIEYPIGDKSRHTEIRILVGDEVWLEFLRGDPRYPIITGWRCPSIGNDVGTRRWHHENFETEADVDQLHIAGTDYGILAGNNVGIDAGTTVEVVAGSTVEVFAGERILLKVGGSTIEITPDMIKALAGQIFLNE